MLQEAAAQVRLACRRATRGSWSVLISRSAAS